MRRCSAGFGEDARGVFSRVRRGRAGVGWSTPPRTPYVGGAAYRQAADQGYTSAAQFGLCCDAKGHWLRTMHRTARSTGRRLIRAKRSAVPYRYRRGEQEGVCSGRPPSRTWAAGSGQRTVGSGSGQRTVGSRQWAAVSGQQAVVAAQLVQDWTKAARSCRQPSWAIHAGLPGLLAPSGSGGGEAAAAAAAGQTTTTVATTIHKKG
jgi:hypothetical protein